MGGDIKIKGAIISRQLSVIYSSRINVDLISYFRDTFKLIF